MFIKINLSNPSAALVSIVLTVTVSGIQISLAIFHLLCTQTNLVDRKTVASMDEAALLKHSDLNGGSSFILANTSKNLKCIYK